MSVLGSIVGGVGSFMGSRAQKKQSKQILRDYNDAETNSLAAYGGARDASLGYYQPYADGGQTGFQNALNMQTGGFQYQPTDPSYQWRFNEGQRAVDRSAAAGGSLYSGGTLKALARYGQGLASTEFQNDFDRNNQLARYGLQAAQGMTGAQDNYARGVYNTEFGAADGRAGAREMRGRAIAGQWGAAGGIAKGVIDGWGGAGGGGSVVEGKGGGGSSLASLFGF